MDQTGQNDFLPITKAEAASRGWDEVDFVYVIGDAYVDHSSFGPAIISRLLEANGFSVGVISQPDWNDESSITVFGKPRLGFLVSSGNMDSMVNHYSVARKRRKQDAYSPGGKSGMRPDRALIVYCNLIRRVYKDSPIIVGGIEASLRRLAHYDYWSDSMRRSVLLDSGADLISYGMGERSIIEVADALRSGLSINDLTFIDGTVYRAKDLDHVYDYIELPSWEDVSDDALNYARSFKTQYENSDPFSGSRLVEFYPRQGYLVQNPPAKPLSSSEMDAVYRLPFTGKSHPSYDEQGGVPALKEVKFSLTSNRGCFGECAFCALMFHQGRIVQSRSHESLVDEATKMTKDPEFKGYISDVGGPTANFREPACKKQMESGACKGKRCLSPKPCASLKANHQDYTELLKKLRAIDGVKKVFVRSGIRFDYVLEDKRHGQEFLDELVRHHVSGQLRVAPEHVSKKVLDLMGKPGSEKFERFVQMFDTATSNAEKEQYVVAYLMSSHPGSTLTEAVELAEFCRDMGYSPEQVQDFYPTPSTLSTVMYHTGVNPLTMEPVYVAKSPHEKAMQRALIQYKNPKNRELVLEALEKAGRQDLIGYEKRCLVKPPDDRRASKAKRKRRTDNKPARPKGRSRKADVNTARQKPNHKKGEHGKAGKRK